jgi:phasin
MIMSDTTMRAQPAGGPGAPGVDAPSSFTDLFEKSLARAKDAHEKMTEIFRNSTDAFEEAFNCANRGSVEYRAKVMEIARANANAAFDAALEAMAAKSPTELVELSSAHARKQFDAAAAQMRELATLTQKVVNETAAPLRSGMAEPFRLAS